MGFRITLAVATGRVPELIRAKYGNIARAAQRTMKQAGKDLKIAARANIAGSGFSKRWQNALRVNVYPQKGESIDAAIFMYHKIGYANVFEDGAHITGQPLLWLPLRNVPKKIGALHMNPQRFAKIGELQSLRSRTPLLGAPVRLSKAAAAKPNPKITLAALRRGKEGTGILKIVPIFVGIKSVNIPKKFNLAKEIQKTRNSLAAIFVKNLKDD